jgi:hypothetical protein
MLSLGATSTGFTSLLWTGLHVATPIQVLLVGEFHRCGAEVVFLNLTLGDSAKDDLLLQVQGVIAECTRAPKFSSADGEVVVMRRGLARSALSAVRR